MIRYALACGNGHEFESWFPSGASYDAQAERGLVTCPFCASTKVEKRLMAPSVSTGAAAPREARDAGKAPEAGKAEAETPAAPPQPVAILSEREQAMRAMMRAIREHVTKTADYVGPSFADEARKIHYGETPHRSIYGEANAADARALFEEGIEFQPLPIGPDDRN